MNDPRAPKVTHLTDPAGRVYLGLLLNGQRVFIHAAEAESLASAIKYHLAALRGSDG